jgi:hypothetical protein
VRAALADIGIAVLDEPAAPAPFTLLVTIKRVRTQRGAAELAELSLASAAIRERGGWWSRSKSGGRHLLEALVVNKCTDRWPWFCPVSRAMVLERRKGEAGRRRGQEGEEGESRGREGGGREGEGKEIRRRRKGRMKRRRKGKGGKREACIPL